MSISNLPETEQSKGEGAETAKEEPVMTNRAAEFIIVRSTTADEHQAQEDLRRQYQDKERVDLIGY